MTLPDVSKAALGEISRLSARLDELEQALLKAARAFGSQDPQVHAEAAAEIMRVLAPTTAPEPVEETAPAPTEPTPEESYR